VYARARARALMHVHCLFSSSSSSSASGASNLGYFLKICDFMAVTVDTPLSAEVDTKFH
jgi:hypothetical protein